MNLAELSGAGDSASIPDYTLTTLRVADFGEVENELAGRVIGYGKLAADAVGGASGVALLKEVTTDLAVGRYAYGSRRYDDFATSDLGVALMGFLSLRRGHKEVTREQARGLIFVDDPAEREKRIDAVLRRAGYKVDLAPKNAVTRTGETTGPSGGEPSSTSSPETPNDAAP